MRLRQSFAALVALLTLGACSAGTPAPERPAPPPVVSSAPPPADPPPPTGLHLPTTAAPRSYLASLTLDPAASVFQGSIEVELTVNEATRVLWLNATELTIEKAELVRGADRQPLRVLAGGADLVGFAAAQPIAPGPATLAVRYSGVISKKDDRGVFTEKEGDDPYLFSQFENIDARRAFPCFDEPGIKVPWQIDLEVPSGDTALSNTPALSEAPSRPGMKRVRFAETKPLPSYLVAFAVGPFDLVDAGRAGSKGTPVRLAVPRGRAADAKTSAATTTTLLGYLEDYFGIPYPYEKLDVVAIPHVVSFGAMENAGLITFYQQGMIARPDEDTGEHQRNYADIIAHEMAHHWFGDLVTMAWWDDVWLNEAFATWMEVKVLSRWRPTWSWETKRVRQVGVAMREDSLVSARKVRQEIVSKDDIQNAFDAITYLKGAALLDMFESWIGPEAFRKGIQGYLQGHAHGNATSRDFAAAISAAAGKKEDVAAVFASFLDQGGVPLVKAELACSKGEAAVKLSQTRFLPSGSSGSSAQRWQIPVCVRWEPGEGRACTLLSEPSAVLPLPGTKGCPTLLLPNAGSGGYYHVAYQPNDLDALLRDGGKKLNLAERLGVVADVAALGRSGALPLGELLGRLPSFAADPSPHVQRAAAAFLFGIPQGVVPEALRASYGRYVDKTFGKKARALGLVRKPGEPEETTALRALVVPLVGSRGSDPTLRKEARALALRWLDDPTAVEAASIEIVLGMAATQGDRALFERLRTEIGKTKDDQRRSHLLAALGSFRDPALARASLDFFLDSDVDPREAMGLLDQDELSTEVVFTFLKESFDRVLARVPSDAAVSLPGTVSRFCDEGHRAAVEAFFKPRIEKISGGPRALSQALEEISLCSTLRASQEASLRAFLKKP
jgi:alanyl aminopeptidase